MNFIYMCYSQNVARCPCFNAGAAQLSPAVCLLYKDGSYDALQQESLHTKWSNDAYVHTHTHICWVLISSHDVHAQLLTYKIHKNCVWTIRAKKCLLLFSMEHFPTVFCAAFALGLGSWTMVQLLLQ